MADYMADDNSEWLSLVSVLSGFESAFDHPESYLKPPAILQKNTLSAIKQIFDFCKKDELSGQRALMSTCPLQELLVENFDDEQIWQEIELQNAPLLRALKQDIQDLREKADQLSVLSGNSNAVKGNQLQDSYHEIVGENTNGFVKSASESAEGSESDNEGSSPDENFDDQTDDDDADDNSDKDIEDDDDNNNDSGKFKISSNNSKKQNQSKKKTQVDDTFFKLSDMLQFLDKEDKRYERAHKKKSQKQSDHDDDDDDDEIDSEPVDYFVDIDSDDTEEEEDEEWNKALGITESLLGRKRELTHKDNRSRKSAWKMKYADFFDPPDGEPSANKGSGEEREEDEENEADEEMEIDEDADEEIEDGNVAASSEDEVDTDEEKSNAISNFEKKQQKLNEKIEKLEKANLAKKPWQMSGEAGGNVRPVNSLLEEDVSFDHTTTAAPDITEETTKNLEDIVKQRIKDEAWDDVERKVKPVMEPFEYKKKLPLNQEKSKLSLSQIYEQEYLKQTQAEAEEQENEQHVEIKTLMTKLFTKLDALSNFYFTPKPPKPELKVVSNVPVISVEEVAPVAVSDAMMLAPEEIHEKKKEQKGSTEKTDTDRKRERRAKKRRQHERAAVREKRRKTVEKLNPGLGNKHSKKAALKKLEKDHQSSKNVSVLKDEGNGKPLKSSSAFFSRLQDEVRDQVKAKKETKKKKEKSAFKVSQLKL